MSKKKSICITGGASGMGLETGLFFSRKGWLVGLLDKDLALLNEAAILFDPETVMVAEVDVTSPDNLDRAMNNFSVFSGGRLDIMFNNAGIANFAGAFEDIKIEEMNKIIDVNFKGVVNGCFTMLEILKSTKNSMLLNTSSVAGLITAPGISVYGATKHAVSSLTENLRIEFERYGIKVSEINPWFTETPILDAEAVTLGAKSQLDREFVNQKTKVYPVEKVVSSVWSAYDSSRIHHPIGFEAKFASFFMRHLPSLIRGLSKKLFKDSFI